MPESAPEILMADGKALKVDGTKKSSGKLKRTLIILLILLTIGFSTVTFYTHRASIIPTFKAKENVFYAVEVASFQDYDSAYMHASTLRKDGGGGYIVFDDGYRVLAAAYIKKSDAESVIDKLGKQGINAKIYSVIIESTKLNNYDEEAKGVFSQALGYYANVYEMLYEISNNLDLNRISESTARTQIQTLGKWVEVQRESFTKSLSVRYANISSVKITVELSSCEQLLDNLANEKLARVNLLCDIRYSYLLVIFNAKALVEEFNKL